jgi:hypothetical protein
VDKIEPNALDPSTLASHLAVDRALDWYAANLARAPGAPFDGRTAQELARALAEKAPCDAELIDRLLIFGRLMHRLAGKPGVPSCNVGDVLVASSGLPPTADAFRWDRETTLDPSTFAKLGFASTSKGIADAQHNNRDAWRSHTERCRSFIDAAADSSQAKHLAVVLGIGHGFDVPLATLAECFDRLILIDVDPAALSVTLDALHRTSPRARIETRVMDLTGINRTMVATLDRLVDPSRDRSTVQNQIEDYVRSYRIGPGPLLQPGEHADLLVSSCVASQLAWPQRAYALMRLEKLGPVVGEAERRWSRAWFEFELRVQQDHIRACADTGEVTVLISDVANRLTALDNSGIEHATGQKVFTLGVDSLLERVPQSLRIMRHGSWLWTRHRPGPSGEPGSWMEVEGVIVSRINRSL